MEICDRFYKRFLEFITIANKLYFLIKEKVIDIDDEIAKNKKVFPENVYPNDSYLFPERWMKRMESYCNSKTFINENLHKGVNKYIQKTFWLLIVVNIILVIGIIAIVGSNLST